MRIEVIIRNAIGTALVIGLAGCGGMGEMSSAKGAMSLFEQVGGMEQIKSLSSNFVNNVAADSRTSKMVANADKGSLTSKLSNQLCALTGGGCPAPLTDAQIAEGAKKVDTSTTNALNDSFSKAVTSLSSPSVVKDTLTKAVGPKLGGIVGALM